MSPVLRCASISLFFLAACAPAEDAVSPRRETPAVPADAVYAGEIVLRGEPALLAGGSATIAIVRRGEETPILSRSWDLGDPAWRSGAESFGLYFVLDARDAWPGTTGAIEPEMELVARFDPDGNPATEEPGVARSRRAVRTGSREIAVDLQVGRQLAVNGAPAGG